MHIRIDDQAGPLLLAASKRRVGRRGGAEARAKARGKARARTRMRKTIMIPKSVMRVAERGAGVVGVAGAEERGGKWRGGGNGRGR